MMRLEKERVENLKPGENFYAQPLSDNKYKWHFTLKGVKDTPYEDGIYHGLLDLPLKYPLEPPNIYFYNESGRYQVNTKICLNITSYHKESWSPVWGVRKMMEAISAYFVCDEGGIGSLNDKPENRKKFAKKSRSYVCEHCGPLTEIEKIIDGLGVSNPRTVITKTDDIKTVDKKVSEVKKEKESNLQNQDINVCISNKADQTFRISESLFESIKTTLCENTQNCGRPEDLKKNPEFVLQLQMFDHKRKEDNFNSTFYVNSLYKIQNEEIVWKIDKTTVAEDQSGCQLILEQNFLLDKQLMISNDLDDPNSMYIGFKVLEPTDFSKLNFYSYILIVMILLSISLTTVYIILNNSLNKLVKKENLA